MKSRKFFYFLPLALAVPAVLYAARGADATEKKTVTIVEFLDYECGFCRSVEKTIAQIEKKYGDRVKVELAHHPLPNHKDARLASAAVIAAGYQGKGKQMHSRLLASEKLDRAALEAHAAALGLDLGRFRTDVEGKADRQIEADLRRAKAAGVRGTPAFLIDGRLVSGARPFEHFEQVIEEAFAGAPPPANVEEDLSCEKKDEDC